MPSWWRYSALYVPQPDNVGAPYSMPARAGMFTITASPALLRETQLLRALAGGLCINAAATELTYAPVPGEAAGGRARSHGLGFGRGRGGWGGAARTG